MLDSSTSMGKSNFQKMLGALMSFVMSSDIESGKIRIGVVVYSTEVKVQFYLRDYSTESEMLKAIDKVKYMAGSTNTSGAINVMAVEMFDPSTGARPTSGKVAIVVTDGVSNVDYHRVIPYSQNARNKGIVILAIGVGLNSTRELLDIAGKPENKLNIDSFDELENRLGTFFRSVCNGKPYSYIYKNRLKLLIALIP